MTTVEVIPCDFLKCLLLEISQEAEKRLNLRIFLEAFEKNFFLLDLKLGRCKPGASEGPSCGRRLFKSENLA